MSRRRAPRFPQRSQIFIGCEGASEVGYAALLQDFARAADLPIYLNIEELSPGAGDPQSRIEMAVRRIAYHKHKRLAPGACFVFLDEDQVAREPQRAENARRLAGYHNIKIIWQRPCFEAVLLRHLPDQATRRPLDTRSANSALLREWPEYEKPMPRHLLARRINLQAVVRAAGAEPELKELLRQIGVL